MVSEQNLLSSRLDALERRVTELADAQRSTGDEITTRRLVIVDRHGTPRVVGEVARGVAELRVVHRAGASAAEVVLYAGEPELPDAAPACGLQVRADGDAVLELDATPGRDGVWQVTGRTGAVPLVSAGPAPPPPPRTARRPSPAGPGPSGS